MKKREFLKTASASAVIAFYGINLSSCSSDETGGGPNPGGDDEFTFSVLSGSFTDLQNEGGWKNDSANGILLVNIGDGTIRAFTNVCTHQQCNNNWGYQAPTFTCSCHGSTFNNAGIVTGGPAPAPLREFSVDRDGDSYTVKLS